MMYKIDRKEYLCDLSDKDNKNCVTFDNALIMTKEETLITFTTPRW